MKEREAVRRYLTITVSTGTEPTNKLWYIKSANLPISAKTGALDLSAFDMRKNNSQPLPIVKFIDDFEASYSIVATNGTFWTVLTNNDAPRNKCGP
jgi:prolyl oligopeptidase